MHSPVTVRDIARACGIHFTTVALALRNSPRVAEKTRDRVVKIANHMGYRPNPLVATLMAQKRAQRQPSHSSVLAYISYPSLDVKDPSIFEKQYLEGARERCLEMGYRLETFHLYSGDLNATRLAQILRTRAIPGLLLGPWRRGKGHLPRPLHGFASVALCNSLVQPGLHRVRHNQCRGSQLACRQLRRKGYRRIGLVLTTHMDRQLDRFWTAGYLSFHENLPAASRPAPLYLPQNSFPANILSDWVLREKPDVILTMHLQVRQWLERNAASLTHKVDIATLDHSPEWGDCPGIFQNPSAQGKEAVSFLVGQIQNNQHGLPSQPLTLMLDGEWVDPGSHGPGRSPLRSSSRQQQ
jgi:LacI family fructose operon transcriptional repressor